MQVGIPDMRGWLSVRRATDLRGYGKVQGAARVIHIGMRTTHERNTVLRRGTVGRDPSGRQGEAFEAKSAPGIARAVRAIRTAPPITSGGERCRFTVSTRSQAWSRAPTWRGAWVGQGL